MKKIYVIKNQEIEAETLKEAKEILSARQTDLSKKPLWELISLARKEINDLQDWIKETLSEFSTREYYASSYYDDYNYVKYQDITTAGPIRKWGDDCYIYLMLDKWKVENIIERQELIMIENYSSKKTYFSIKHTNNKYESINLISADTKFEYLDWLENKKDDKIKKVKEQITKIKNESLKLAKDYEIQTFNQVKKYIPDTIEAIDNKIKNVNERIKELNDEKNELLNLAKEIK